MNEDKKPVPRKCRAVEPAASLTLKAGLVMDACQPGVYLVAALAARLGVAAGDYLEIDCEEKGTKIVRQICSCGCFRGGRSGFVYLDAESAAYLLAEPHQELVVRKSPYPLNVP